MKPIILGCFLTKEYLDKEAEALREYTKRTDLPFLKEFCGERGYTSSTLTKRLATEKSELFMEAVQELKDKQEIELAKGGLEGRHNPSICKFVLQNKAKWTDKQEIKHDGISVNYGHREKKD